MINKKILLSLFTIGLLACIASAGTWAYFQDTLDVNNTEITTANLTSQYSLNSGTWTTFSGDTNPIGPFNITDRIPGDGGTLASFSIKNMGNTRANVTATITPTSLGVVNDISIRVGGQTIYTDGNFNSNSPFTVDLGTVSANGADPANADIDYSFDNNDYENQNSMENKSIAFDMSIAVRATH